MRIVFLLVAFLAFVILRLTFRGRTLPMLVAALVVGLVVEMVLEWLALRRG
jgi:hypothetical protein